MTLLIHGSIVVGSCQRWIERAGRGQGGSTEMDRCPGECSGWKQCLDCPPILCHEQYMLDPRLAA